MRLNDYLRSLHLNERANSEKPNRMIPETANPGIGQYRDPKLILNYQGIRIGYYLRIVS